MEFESLQKAGLYAAKTAGNGNCLFHALSDQLYGDQSRHQEIRAAVIRSMRANSDYYKHFIEVHPGGGTRRNPKRKNTGAFSSKQIAPEATAAEKDAVFEGHLARMARGGTYGDNMEITAFSKAYNAEVIIYRSEYAYCVRDGGITGPYKSLHIAYHTYEHYSSVRNIRGPHTGIPNTEALYESVEAGNEAKEQLVKGPYIEDWMIDLVIKSQSILEDRMVIQKKLQDAGGNVDTVVSNLLDAQHASSESSSRDGSSSIEREQDSDDEDFTGPKKKQDRRLSRASHAALKQKEGQRKHDLAVRMKERQLPSTKESASPPVISINDVKLHDSDETEEEDWRNASSYKDSESASVSTSASEYSGGSKRTGQRLKLSQPKKEADKLQPPSKKAHQPIDASASQTAAPRRRRLYRRDQLDMKKSIQKHNAKERKKNNAAQVRGPNGVSLLHDKIKDTTPAVETRIKVLCI
ncbi:MAG: hypothetical protein L6R37_001983 [Teloschistes peruensis]|nr:MAG: hypothetical protein L6R37_001983 [Teloschistes peruensis]